MVGVTMTRRPLGDVTHLLDVRNTPRLHIAHISLNMIAPYFVGATFGIVGILIGVYWAGP